MKKTLILFILSVFIFNSFGYRLLLTYIEYKATNSLELNLDNDNYDANSLVQIIIPITLPYCTSQKYFERIDGETEFNHRTYKYVKRKVLSDRIILMCIPDNTLTKLRKTGKILTDIFNEKKPVGNGKLKFLQLKDLYSRNFPNAWINSLKFKILTTDYFLNNSLLISGGFK